MIIEYKDADAALKKLNAESESSYYWDGWHICKFTPNNAAIYEISGVFNRGLGWGYLNKYEIESSGRWTIDN